MGRSQRHTLSRFLMRSLVLFSVAGLFASVSSGATAQEWQDVGREGAARAAIEVRTNSVDDGPSPDHLILLVPRASSGRSARYALVVARYDCASGTRWDRFRTEWSSNRDPVRTEYPAGTLKRLTDDPDLNDQFEVVCGRSEDVSAWRFRSIQDFVSSARR